jgi:hypothetical protein
MRDGLLVLERECVHDFYGVRPERDHERPERQTDGAAAEPGNGDGDRLRRGSSSSSDGKTFAADQLAIA